MKVKDLIEMLQGCDPEATVLLGTQPSWPFEVGIEGVVQRSDFDDVGEDEYSDNRKSTDVLILEGGQIRYGQKAAWEVR